MNVISFIFTISLFVILFILRKPIIEILRKNDIGLVILDHKEKLVIITCVSFILFILSTIVVSIPIGTTGVVVNGFGIGSTIDHGIHVKNIFDDVDIVPWYSQTIDMNILVNSNDSIPVNIRANVVYRIERGNIGETRIKYPNYENIIEQSTRSISNAYASEYDSLELTGEMKIDFINKTKSDLSDLLSTMHINLEILNIESISLPDSYQNAIISEKSAQKEREAIVSKALADAESIGIIDEKLSSVSESFLKWYYISAIIDEDSNVNWILPFGNFNFDLGEDVRITE